MRAALPLSRSGQLVDIVDPALGSLGLQLRDGEMQTLYSQGRVAILANVGMLVAADQVHEYHEQIRIRYRSTCARMDDRSG